MDLLSGLMGKMPGTKGTRYVQTFVGLQREKCMMGDELFRRESQSQTRR